MAQEGAPDYLVQMIQRNLSSQARMVRETDNLVLEIQRKEERIQKMRGERRDNSATQRAQGMLSKSVTLRMMAVLSSLHVLVHRTCITALEF